MLAIEKIQKDPKGLLEMLKKRRWDIFSEKDILKLEHLILETKQFQGEIQGLRSERNRLSQSIGNWMRQGDTSLEEKAQEQKAEVKQISTSIQSLEKKQKQAQEQLNDMLYILPNWLDPEVLDGGEEDNDILEQTEKLPSFNFAPRSHYEIGEDLGCLDMSRGAKLSGSRFYLYRGVLAALERALLNYMLNLHVVQHGYEEIFFPSLVKHQAMFCTGQFPKFKGEYYNLDRDQLSLIPTGEVPLVSMYQDEIIPESALPLRLVGASSCFRREAGAHGKDTRGLVRVHQFQKVELVQIVHPEKSEEIHLQMLQHAQSVLDKLELPYRKVLKASGDTGSTASKSYDLEVWMPGLNRWLEISSISNCRDYQARRGRIRFKGNAKKGKTEFVHTLNASGLAAGRCMIAIMENFQLDPSAKDGLGFAIPRVLEPYMPDFRHKHSES